MGVVEVEKLTKRLWTQAYVEVQCILPHDSIFYRGSYHCRYAGGNVEHTESGLRIKDHQCHLCTCYWLMKANTPPDKQKCDNCGGPLVVSQESCWPDLLMVDNFIEPARWMQ